MKRWIRGYKWNIAVEKHPLVLHLGIVDVLGLYSSIVGMMALYASGTTSSISYNDSILSTIRE